MLRKTILVGLLIAGPALTIRQSLMVLPTLEMNAANWDADPRTSQLWYYAKLEAPWIPWIDQGIDDWQSIRAR